MDPPRIYADFQKLDDERRTILVCRGTAQDLEEQRVTLVEGMRVMLYSDDADDAGRPDDLEVDATIEFDRVDSVWVARFDPNGFRHASDRLGGSRDAGA